MRTMLLKFFFLIPSWFFNIFIKKRPPYRGHIFDQQSHALISLQPSIDLTTIPDNEISDIRKLITENRIKNKLSLNTKNPVMKFDHFVGIDKNVLPFSLAIGNRAKLRGLNLVGIRRKNFDKSEISRINDIHYNYTNGTKLDNKERVDSIFIEYDKLLNQKLGHIQK